MLIPLYYLHREYFYKPLEPSFLVKESVLNTHDHHWRVFRMLIHVRSCLVFLVLSLIVTSWGIH